MHELAHVSLHLDCHENDLFIDDLSLTGEDPLEEEADTLAQNALIPPKLWTDSPVRKEPPYSQSTPSPAKPTSTPP